jgi:hypothetical protein
MELIDSRTASGTGRQGSSNQGITAEVGLTDHDTNRDGTVIQSHHIIQLSSSKCAPSAARACTRGVAQSVASFLGASDKRRDKFPVIYNFFLEPSCPFGREWGAVV